MENNQAILQVEKLTKYFGGLCAVKNFDLTLEQGELIGLIGPNGAARPPCST
jgi:branched-chain amino acid transport system ATP-binding protein